MGSSHDAGNATVSSEHHDVSGRDQRSTELGTGGTGVLSVDGKEVATNSLGHGIPVTFPEDETFDVGLDTRTGVALVEHRYDTPFEFTGKIDKLTFEPGRKK